MNKKIISIIIPAYNEEKNISKVLKKISKLKSFYKLEVIVIDDGSKDLTSKIASKYTKHVFKLKKNLGKGGAFIEGIKKSSGEYIIQIDADDQFQVSDIPEFINKLDNNFDIVLGTRFDKGEIEKGSISRKNFFGNWLMTQAVVFFSGIMVTDIMAGFKGFKRRALEKLDLKTNHFGYEAEVIVKAGKLNLSVAEIPIIYHKRIHGSSSVHALRDGLKIIWTITLMYFTFPGQPLGKGAVGKRILKYLSPIWLIVGIPLLSYIYSHTNSEFFIHLLMALIVYLAVFHFSRSKFTAVVASGLSTFPLFMPPNNLFVPEYIQLALMILATAFFLKQKVNNKGTIVFLFLLISFLIFFMNLSINFSIIFLLYVIGINYFVYRVDYPKISQFAIAAGILIFLSAMSGIQFFYTVGVSLGLSSFLGNVLLFNISFKRNFKPLFSFNRILPISLSFVISLILLFLLLHS